MNIQYHNEEIPLIIIDDFYDDTEVREIMVELDYLSDNRRMIEPFKDKTGVTEIKNVGCVYLDEFYFNRKSSNILTVTEKIFSDECSIINNHPHWFFDMRAMNTHHTQILYYEDANEYQSHYDESRLTVLTYFYKEPKRFEGGDLLFPDFNMQVECVNNRVVIFPSIVNHASTPIVMDEAHKNKKRGKYCITQFLDRTPQ